MGSVDLGNLGEVGGLPGSGSIEKGKLEGQAVVDGPVGGVLVAVVALHWLESILSVDGVRPWSLMADFDGEKSGGRSLAFGLQCWDKAGQRGICIQLDGYGVSCSDCYKTHHGGKKKVGRRRPSDFGRVAKIVLRNPRIFRGFVSSPAHKVHSAVAVLALSQSMTKDSFHLVFLCGIEEVSCGGKSGTFPKFRGQLAIFP
ncbi:hypothetical protein C8R44DRAFT_729694 [Mycena epipterygia]|nr:hypothetical protein C8R44DRAFT_729694 [Mycena epipterygia]